MASSVDLSGSVRFDLQSGTVRLGDDEKGLVVPVSVLSSLLANATPDARGKAGRDLGAHIGRGVARRAGSGHALLSADLEHAATLLAAELAVTGLGACNLERWGRALVVHVVDSPIDHADFVASVVEGALTAATARPLSTALLSDAGGVRVLVASERGALRVRGWMEQGTSWSDALVRLQAGGGS
jgi:hypothetical protein